MEIIEDKSSKIIIDEDFFKNLREEIQGEDFYFSLGFFSIKLKLKKNIFKIFSDKFQNREGEFYVSPKIYKSPVAIFKYKKGKPEIYNIDFIENEKNLIFYAYNFASLIELKSLENSILALGDVDENILSGEIENFLRVYSGLILPKYNSLLIHSSVVLTEKGAFLFFGHSGAGKSTIAKLFKDCGYKTLSDDLNILILKDGIKVMSSPYLSEIEKAEGGIFPVYKIFYLKKDNLNKIEKISKLKQRALLYGSLPVLNSLKFFQNEIFLYISEVINKKEVDVLHFRKDEEVVKWLQLH